LPLEFPIKNLYVFLTCRMHVTSSSDFNFIYGNPGNT
jgi:hypothetical protein